MRALRFSKFGDPMQVLMLEDAPLPQPAAGQVRIRLSHRSINPSDLLTVTGEYGRLPKALPVTAGFEGMGVIDALGEGVTGFELGQRVIPLAAEGGTWAEYTLCSTKFLLPVMPEISDQTAAQFLVNPVTAWVMVTSELPVGEGEWLLQSAAGSTLGRIILQIAQLRGFKTVNLVRRREQVDELLALGADAVICTEDDDVVEQVFEVTGGGVKYAVDAVGGKTGGLMASCLRGGGTLLIYGVLSMDTTPIDTGRVLFTGTTIRGFWLTYWFRATPPEQTGAVLMQLMQLMAEGHLVPPVEAEYDLADFKKAIEHANTPGRQGKILLTG